MPSFHIEFRNMEITPKENSSNAYQNLELA